jgi:two-component system cell cycle response regulator
MSDDIGDRCETLIVDDSATILASAKKMLQDEYLVHTAKDGKEAWDILNENQGIKIVFSDLQMPGMNGMQLLLKIRESNDPRISKLPVIMITGQSDSSAGKRAVFEIGATDFIGKPFDAFDLLSRARTNTGKSRRSSDENGGSQDFFVTPRNFQNIGKKALARAFETKEEFTVLHIDFSNHEDIKNTIGDKSIRQIIVSIVKRINGVLREEDVATRIGESKFAVLMSTDSFNAKAAVDRLCDYMKKMAFEMNGQELTVSLAYGYSSANCYDKKLEFSTICDQADAALEEAGHNKLTDKVAVYGDAESGISEGAGGKEIDLWPALTHVVEGDYDKIDSAHVDELVKCMNAFLKHHAK